MTAKETCDQTGIVMLAPTLIDRLMVGKVFYRSVNCGPTTLLMNPI